MNLKIAMLLFCGFMVSGRALGEDINEKAARRLAFRPSTAAASTPSTWSGQIHDIRAYGALGDGKTDDTQAIRAAVQKAREGDQVLFSPGKYRICAPIVVNRSGITLVGRDAEIIYSPAGGGAFGFQTMDNGKIRKRKEDTVFLVQGNLPAQGRAVAGNQPEESRRLNLAEPARDIEAGDLLLVACADSGKQIRRMDKLLYTNREQNFITRVERVEGTAVVLADPIPFRLEAANKPFVFRIEAVRNVSIRDLSITIDSPVRGSGDRNGITLVHAAFATVRNVAIRHALKAAISLHHSYGCEITGCRLTDMGRTDSSHGLCVSLNRSHHCLIGNNVMIGCRHAVLLDHGNSNCVVENNRIENATTVAAIDLHGECNSYNVLRANTIRGCKAAIAVGGGGEVHFNDGPFNAIAANTIIRCDTGIQIQNETPLTILGENRFEDIVYSDRKLVIKKVSEGQILKVGGKPKYDLDKPKDLKVN